MLIKYNNHMIYHDLLYPWCSYRIIIGKIEIFGELKFSFQEKKYLFFYLNSKKVLIGGSLNKKLYIREYNSKITSSSYIEIRKHYTHIKNFIFNSHKNYVNQI